MVDQVAADADSAGFLNIVGGDFEYRPFVDRFGRDEAGLRAGVFRRGRFRHTPTIKECLWKAEVRAGSAMLPGMGVKPRTAIVGKGNLGSALAQSLGRAGYSIKIVGRSRS